jgi:hypothetical protein
MGTTSLKWASNGCGVRIKYTTLSMGKHRWVSYLWRMSLLVHKRQPAVVVVCGMLEGKIFELLLLICPFSCCNQNIHSYAHPGVTFYKTCYIVSKLVLVVNIAEIYCWLQSINHLITCSSNFNNNISLVPLKKNCALYFISRIIYVNYLENFIFVEKKCYANTLFRMG